MGSAYHTGRIYRSEPTGAPVGAIGASPLGQEPIAKARLLVAPRALCGRCLAAPARWGRWICGPCERDVERRALKRAVQHPGGGVSPGFQEGRLL